MTIWRKMLSPWLLIKLFIKLPRSCQRGDVLFYLHLILDQMLNPTHRLSDQIPMRCQIIPGIKCRIKCWIADFVNLNRYRKMSRFTIPQQTWICVATKKRRNNQLFYLNFCFICLNSFALSQIVSSILIISSPFLH